MLFADILRMKPNTAVTIKSQHMARAMAVHAARVEDPADLEGAIKDVLAHDGPALLDVVVAPQELAMPPTIEVGQVKGFSLWALQAVMNGWGDQLIDLARTNLLR